MINKEAKTPVIILERHSVGIKRNIIDKIGLSWLRGISLITIITLVATVIFIGMFALKKIKNSESRISAPPGYEVIYPVNSPPYLEKSNEK